MPSAFMEVSTAVETMHTVVVATPAPLPTLMWSDTPGTSLSGCFEVLIMCIHNIISER